MALDHTRLSVAVSCRRIYVRLSPILYYRLTFCLWTQWKDHVSRIICRRSKVCFTRFDGPPVKESLAWTGRVVWRLRLIAYVSDRRQGKLGGIRNEGGSDWIE